MDELVARFSKPIQRILGEKGFGELTEPQRKAIPLVAAGKNVLIIAPTGTGKTEAALLPILDSLVKEGARGGIRALYISPLRALNRDLMERLQWWCGRLDIKVAVRHGDTETRERGKQALAPPEVLITTPETLQAILPGRTMRRHLSRVRWIIVDEVHELTNDKRGSQLTIALERLRKVTTKEPQIIGLSATIGSPQEVARFLVGYGRSCEMVRVSVAKDTKIDVILPEAEPSDVKLAERIATFPEVAARLRVMKELIDKNRSTLIFTNTRSESEVLASRFRIWDINTPVSIHHGSLAKSARVDVESSLKKGELRGVVCTSSLELGIDIGSIDLVIQYNSPRQATRLLQRVGRAGHWVGGTSNGVIIAMDSDDALESTVIVKRSLREELEDIQIVKKPLDVLAHQVAGLLLEDGRRSLDEILELVRRAYPFHDLTEGELVEVLDYMSGRRPRLALYLPKERLVLKPKPSDSLYKYYFENLSMIPEERHYLVVDDANDEPVGTLDEAFVAEYGEPGVKFIERGSPWQIIHVFKDRVYVKAEKDPTGAIPDWVGDEIPVPFEVAQEVGAIRRGVVDGLKVGLKWTAIVEKLQQDYPVSGALLKRALREIREQAEGRWEMPTDMVITLEGWEGYVIVSSALGLNINKTLSRLLGFLITARTGSGVRTSQDPYRIFLRTAADPRTVAEILLQVDPARTAGLVASALERTGLFKRRLLHVSKRFGVIEKDADVSEVGMSQLMEGMRGSVVWKEAMKEVLYKDLDVEGTAAAIRRMREGKYIVTVMEQSLPLSPISRNGVKELSWKTDLVPADRLRRLLLESGKARLLNEARVAVCTNCFRYVETVRAKKFMDTVRCPDCGSTRIGLLGDDPLEVAQMAAEKAEMDKVSERFKGMLKSAVESGELISQYGLNAVLAQVSRGLSKPMIITLATSNVTDLDYFVDRILAEERAALKSRFRAREGQHSSVDGVVGPLGSKKISRS